VSISNPTYYWKAPNLLQTAKAIGFLANSEMSLKAQ